MRAALKRVIVAAACRGLISPSVATVIIRRGGLAHV